MIRIYQPSDHPMLVTWWQGHGFPPVPAGAIPKLSVIGMVKDKPVAFAALYMDNSVGVSMLEWIVSDPEASPRHVAVTICSIVAFLKERASSMDYGIMLATCRQPSLSALLVREGFEVSDNEVIHHITLLRNS